MIRAVNHVNVKSTAEGVLLGYVGIIIIEVLKRRRVNDCHPKRL
jgi:hypothetical protein